jgi:SNF family Na+-dependent transporter
MSLLSGYTVFGFVGHMADKAGVTPTHVMRSGPLLVFSVLPTGFADIENGRAWCIVFFLMLTIIGIGVQVCILIK